MTLDPNNIVQTGAGPGSDLRFFPAEGAVQPFTFSTGSGTLAKGTAVTYNTSTGFYQVFRGAVDEVSTITANATPNTGGTFTLTITNPVSGVSDTTAAIDFDATAAEVQAALEALDNVVAGDVTCVQTSGTDLGDAGAVVTLSWGLNGGDYSGQDLTFTIDDSGLTGGSGDHALAQATQGGTAESNGTNILKGFVWPDAITLSSTGEVLGNVMFAGQFHVDDVPEVAGAYGASEVAAAIRTAAFRESGLIPQGLANWIR